MKRSYLWLAMAASLSVTMPDRAMAQSGKGAFDIDFQGWNQALSSQDERFLKPGATNFGVSVGGHFFSAGSVGLSYQRLPLDSSGSDAIWAASAFGESGLTKANRVQPFIRVSFGIFGQSADSDFGYVLGGGAGFNVYFGEHFAIRPILEYNGRVSGAASGEDQFGLAARIGIRLIF